MAIDPEEAKRLQKEKEQKAFDEYFKNSDIGKKSAAELDNIKMLQDQLTARAGERPGIALTKPNEFEKKAGVTPPGYEGTRDVRTGKLLSEFTIDPYSGEANQALKKQAFAQGLSPWAQSQIQAQKLLQQDQAGLAGRQAMQAQRSAQQQLATSGGLKGGAAAMLARQGQRDLLNAQQGISRAGMGQRLGVEQQDIDRKQDLLGRFSDKETGAQQTNINQASGDINRKAMFDMERYKQQMQAWGAKQSADATRSAGGGGGKK